MFTPEQQKLRRSGISGSWVAAICGLDPYRGPIDAFSWYVDGTESTRNFHMERGIHLEDGIAQWYASRQTIPVSMTSPGITQHPTKNHLCTPDRIVTAKEWGGERRLLSVKCPWRGGSEWGDSGSDKVPMSYFLQLQWEMHVCGAAHIADTSFADLAATINGDLKIYNIAGDTEVQEGLVESCERFWRNHVVTKIPPKVDGSDGYADFLKRRHPIAHGSLKVSTAEQEKWARAYKKALLAQKAAKQKMSDASNMLRALIGDTEGFAGDGFQVTWRNGNGKTSWKEVATELGASADLVAKHTPKNVRNFRATFGDEDDDE